MTLNTLLTVNIALRDTEVDTSIARAQKVIAFWREVGPKGWFATNPDIDVQFCEQFSDLHFAAARGQCDHWLSHAEAGLALIILLDQYPRNVFRGTAHMFATDPRARMLAEEYIKNGLIEHLDAELRLFACLPFVHSENIADHDYALDLYQKYAPDSVEWAQHHRSIISQYGRFPHRNSALGRSTTLAEQRFLDQGGFRG